MEFKRDQTHRCFDMFSFFRYSFSVPPKLDLHVRPKLGEREVTFCHVTEWIEKKLQDEFQVKEKMRKSWRILSAVKSVLISSLTFLPFQRVFVLPNMDDIYLPLMHSGVDCPQTGQRQSSRCPCSPSSSAESIQRIPAESDQCLTDQRTKTQETEEKMKNLCLWGWKSFKFNVYK